MKYLRYNLAQFIRYIGQTLVCGRLFTLPGLISVRFFVYRMLFNFKGKHIRIGEHVIFERGHKKKDSFIKIGNNVHFVRNNHIDYTGYLEIKDNVILTNGVQILTHHRNIDAYIEGKDINIQNKLVIGEFAYIGTNALVLSSCHYIGKYARIGAGAVVTKDVPDHAVVAGVPAKIIKYLEKK